MTIYKTQQAFNRLYTGLNMSMAIGNIELAMDGYRVIKIHGMSGIGMVVTPESYSVDAIWYMG